ncbi:hypothetical protein CDD81_5384 [Ophiocordyceps australis]|uniref:FUN14 domain-containing protein n=1 Tax=Ophiocordyceps australis TaxID=1399860 RepID=A0A2C5XVA4_9HYPO|nr:hypothetical protein CDD81_5384 [Ophiocordyceps australis]
MRRLLYSRLQSAVPTTFLGVAILPHLYPPLRLDSRYPTIVKSGASSKSRVSPHLVRQVSSGSLAGLATGIIIAFLSRALVVLGALFGLSLHLASQWGLDVPQLLHIKRQPVKSYLSRLGTDKPWFALSFALTFILTAFVRL